jgi:hypothetical protein
MDGIDKELANKFYILPIASSSKINVMKGL